LASQSQKNRAAQIANAFWMFIYDEVLRQQHSCPARARPFRRIYCGAAADLVSQARSMPSARSVRTADRAADAAHTSNTIMASRRARKAARQHVELRRRLADLLALSADERLALSADEIAAHPRLRRFVTEKQNQQTLAMARGFSANC
jgi:hypothetical protein